ncbi:Hypothetical predicted protein, partial [Podarcis lilfordi]
TANINTSTFNRDVLVQRDETKSASSGCCKIYEDPQRKSINSAPSVRKSSQVKEAGKVEKKEFQHRNVDEAFDCQLPGTTTFE